MSDGTILLVDDSQENLKLLTILLSHDGYTVRTATRGAEALEELASLVPVAMVTDIQMPGMSGLELARLVRAEPAKNDMLILAVSANAMQMDIDEAIGAGCDGYITKPVDTRTFADEVGSYVRRGRTKS